MSTKMEILEKEDLPLGDYNRDGIDRKGARSMIQAYQTHPNRLTTSQGGTTLTLRGLKVTREDLEALLLPNINADEFMILFAVSQKDLGDDSIPDDEKSLTAILAPVKNNTYITSYSNQTGVDLDALRNVFEPCPNKCNATLETSYANTFL